MDQNDRYVEETKAKSHHLLGVVVRVCIQVNSWFPYIGDRKLEERVLLFIIISI